MRPHANNVTMTSCKVATHLWPGTVGIRYMNALPEL